MATRYYQGTVAGQGSSLDLEGTSKKLRKAMKGLGTDEKAIIEVLSTHTNMELQQVKDYYKTMFGRILKDDFKSELSGHIEKLCLYRLLSKDEFRAVCLKEAMGGIGTDETTLIEILCLCSNAEIADIKRAYKERFKTELEKDIIGDTSGHFKRILVSIVQGNRSEAQVIDDNQVKTDTDDLLKAGVKSIGTDESVFNQILVLRSLPHLQAVFKAYAAQDQQDIVSAIQKETSGNLKDAYVAIARYVVDPLDYFAECFYKSMKGAGTKDERLMQLVINHCETDLKDIADTYIHKYGTGLSRAISEDTSGDYRKLLVALTNVPGS